MSPDDRPKRRQRPVAGLIGALVVTLLSLVFVTSFIGALHNPGPRSAPLGIVGPPEAASMLGRTIDHAVPNGFTVTNYATATAARNAINHRTIDAALVPGPHAQNLVVAQAVSSGLTNATIKVFTAVAARTHVPLAVTDIRPLHSSDPDGLSQTFFVVALLVPSFMFGNLLVKGLAPGRPPHRQLAVIVIYALVVAAVAVAMADGVIGALTGAPWDLFRIGALLAFAVAVTSAAAARWAAGIGVLVFGMLFIPVGIASSGVTLGPNMITPWYADLGKALPPGSALPAVLNTTYFHANAIALPLGVLSAWAFAGTLAMFMAAILHRPIPGQRKQLVAVTEAVHSETLDAQVNELRAAQRLQVFSDLAIAGAGQDEIVHQASALAGVPVILADLADRVLACGAAREEVTSLLAGFGARSRAVTVPGRIGYDPAAGWLVATVGPRGLDWGRLIFVLSGPPDAGARVLAERAASTLALARLVDDRGTRQTPERVAHARLIAALAGPGYVDPADVEARIIALGVPLAGRRLLPVVIRLSEPADRLPTVTESLAAASRDLGAPAVCGALDEQRVGALLALQAGADADDVLDRLARRLRSEVLANADMIGVGLLAPDVADARDGLARADEAAGAAARIGAVQPFVRITDLGLSGLLFQLRADPRVLAFAERELGPLLRHDAHAGTNLAQVLKTYLDSGGNVAEAASRAGLALPTLYERLKQIEQLLSVSLEAGESRLALQVAILTMAAEPKGSLTLGLHVAP